MDAKTDINQASKVTRQKKSHKKWAAIVFFVILIIFFDTSPFGGNGRFYMKWAECGQKPVEITSGFFGSKQTYVASEVFQPIRMGYIGYYCTPEEAQNAGF